MFSNEIKVEGRFIKGKIVKQTGFPHRLVSKISLTNNTWSAGDLRSIANEFNQVANELDKQNGKSIVIDDEDFSGNVQYTGKVTPSRGIVTDHIIGSTSIGVILDRLKGKEIKISVIE